jgi:Ca2+-binding RTX toxin-like protein
MSGGGGIDTLDYSFVFLALETFLDLADTTAQNTRSAGADTIIGFENVVTAGGDDRILGTGADNRFETFGGADTLKSKDGADVLLAGGGDDLIDAGVGADLVTGGGGKDTMRGGLGDDDFIYEDAAESGAGALADVIRDFSTSDGDRIDLSAVYAGELSYIGAAFFTGDGQGEIQVGAVIGGQLVRVDIDGDGDTDMDILVANSGLSGGATDFVL